MAALTIRFTLTASQTLDEILGFIAQDNPEAAAKLAGRIEHGLKRLASFPASGRKIPEAPERREREVVVPPAVRLFCRVDGTVLWMLYAMRSEQAFDTEMLGDDVP